MTDLTKQAEQYIAMWNEKDAAAREAVIERLWAPAGRYVDPLAAVAGREGIDAVVQAVQGQFPGMSFTLLGPVDAHHDQARFGWALGVAGDEPIVVGFDVIEVDANGQIETVLGFLDKVPAGA
jgi:hypothetical protein